MPPTICTNGAEWGLGAIASHLGGDQGRGPTSAAGELPQLRPTTQHSNATNITTPKKKRKKKKKKGEVGSENRRRSGVP